MTVFKTHQTKQAVTLFLALIASLTLSGCAGMNDSFGCNATASDSCLPIAKVNAKANAGYYANQDGGAGVDANSAISSDSYQETNTSSTDTAAFGQTQGYPVTTPSVGSFVRAGEQVQQIWIAPYKDSDNNYHEPSYVYTVLHPSHWVGPQHT